MAAASSTVPEGEEREPRWAVFDADWYLRRYPEVQGWMQEEGFADPFSFYQEIGQRHGHSPNRYFDEIWYRSAYPEVSRDIEDGTWRSGFEHYCRSGSLTHSPHWLFDERGYARRYPQLTRFALQKEGLRNHYDHYLERGETGFFWGSRFFDETLCQDLACRFPEYFGEEGLFGSWLALPSRIADAGRVSWYFDPVWYLDRYPDVAAEIEAGRYGNALHHYLTNPTPRRYDPLPFFSERYYALTHQDVAPALESGAFRNGYDHFVRFGAYEGRNPAEEIDLATYKTYPQVRAQCEGRSDFSPFAHLVAARSGAEFAVGADAPEIAEAQSRALFLREAEALLPVFARQPLDFTVHGVPEVSVILVVHNQIALTMQALASLRANYAGSIELILVNSGSGDETRHLPSLVQGAVILNYRYNVGYLEGCNAGLEKARAPAVLYLNNDLRLYPQALSHALARLHSSGDIGAVGGKLVRTNMRLQEAGSIIWRDGATYGYRREDDPNLPEANFVRDVDYCSAAFLLVRTGLLKRLGGYDRRFLPAYFEDTDLCVRLQEIGARVVYEPLCVVEHLEFGSSGHAGSHALIQRNLRRFAQAHKNFLRHQQPAHIRNALLGRERRTTRRRILFIEDRIPLRTLGSGYVRSNDIVHAMVALGYRVTVFPIYAFQDGAFSLYEDFPDEVELAAGQDIGTLAAFLEERAGYYDLLWVGRTHNITRLLPILNESSRYLLNSSAILDTEVVAAPRTMERIKILGLPKPAESLDDMLSEELQSAHYCQHIVAVTERDAALVRRAGYSHVSVLGHVMNVHPSPSGFASRRDILFLGAMHDETSPNYDSLIWFVRDVLPHLEDWPLDIRFRIAGYVHPDIDLTPFALHPRVDILGPVENLPELFDRHRVFVAPTRFAGGLPFKIHEAASYGVPVVATSLIRDQVGWTEGEEILSADARDPEGFAQALRRVYEDGALWKNLRHKALEAVKRDCSEERFHEILSNILSACIV